MGTQLLNRHGRQARAEHRIPCVQPCSGSGRYDQELFAGRLVAVGVMTGISVPFGYLVGKPIRPQTAFMTGSLGFVGGFMWAYQNSAGRLMGAFDNALSFEEEPATSE